MEPGHTVYKCTKGDETFLQLLATLCHAAPKETKQFLQ